jgi:hypothetical protein
MCSGGANSENNKLLKVEIMSSLTTFIGVLNVELI